MSRGTLKLIKEGAAPVTEAKDVLDFYLTRAHERKRLFDSDWTGSKSEEDREDTLEDKILHELQSEPQGIDVLVRELRIGVAEVGTALSVLELRGIIIQEGEKYFLC